MASATYLKGVRTRYKNALEKNVDTCKELLTVDLSNCNLENHGVEVNMCLQYLNSYIEKLETQSEKLAGALENSDSEFVNQITEEDSALCETAFQHYIRLQQHQQIVLVSKESEKSKHVEKEKTTEMYTEKLVELQEEMQQLMKMQIKQQEKLTESQTKKSKLSSVKLPKLELISFNGDKTRWIEFWDSFSTSVHSNTTLSNIEKFNYLKSKVSGEAQRAISGISLTAANYHIAVDILKERFGNTQDVVDLHYNKLINLQPATNKTRSLRALFDTVSRHLRSLEVLKQNTNQDVFVSILRSKIPEDVLMQLEIQNGTDNKWTILTLNDKLKEYIVARERTEKKENEPGGRKQVSVPSVHTWNKPVDSKQNYTKSFTSSAHAMTVVKKSPQQKIDATNKQTNYADQCRYCQQKHWSDECRKFRTISERKAQLKGSCFKCLKAGHRSDECRRSKTCVHCGEVNSHHRSLCPKKFKLKEAISQLVNESSTPGTSEDIDRTEESALVSSNEMVLMQTALTNVQNPNTSDSKSVRLLLDSGSQRTYITEKLAKELKLEAIGEQEIKLITFGSTSSQTLKTKYSNISVKLKNGELVTICVNIVPTISGELHRRPVSSLNSDNLKHIVGSVELADTLPTESESTTIEMLVGNDYYLDFILCQRIELQSGLFLLGSKLGWILTGRTYDEENQDSPCMLILTHGHDIAKSNLYSDIDSVVPVKPNLQDFWNVETIGICDKAQCADDEIAKEMFKSTVQFHDGRYEVKWPWIEESPELPPNRELAMGRLKSCVKKMNNRPELLEKYDAVIKDQISKGVIEQVHTSDNSGLIHYLPHHAVIKPQKTTTKLRLVYDASAKSKKENKSLNECLYRGPVMLQDLCGMILRFRLKNIAIVADIEKAFLQIGLQQDQRDVTRFFWLKDIENPTLNTNNIQEFRFCRVPFGIISSPFLLGATVDCHLKSYNDPIAEKLRDNIYVDNVIVGVDKVSEAVQTYSKAKAMFKDASMNLREWITNNRFVNEFIPREDKAATDDTKVLGYNWDSKEDTLNVKAPKINDTFESVTKRSVLKSIASVFDPLGLLSPVMLPGKILLQSLWKKQLDWDDTLSTEDQNNWTLIVKDIKSVESIQIPRCVCGPYSDQTEYSLLCYCDASEKAYSTAVYLRSEHEQRTTVNLIFCKTRLAPVKQLTIPRLELLAVLIGVRCIEFVKEQLKLPIKETYLWTDSKCVLDWLKSDKTLKVFVKNRVSEIKEHKHIQFSYIPTKENPTDVATRGTTLERLSSSNSWWHGPKWLQEPVGDWPVFEGKSSIAEEPEEDTEAYEKKNNEPMLLEQDKQHNQFGPCVPPFGIDSSKYSTVTKLIRVTALVKRSVCIFKKEKCEDGALTSAELSDAKTSWIQHVQEKHFYDVIRDIQTKKSNNIQRQLGLFIDENRIIRCRGRLENAGISEGSRYPILLPRNEYITVLLIEKAHKELLHSGVSQTLAKTRQQYWIVHGRATVKSVLRNCSVCKRYEGGCYKMPPMCPLPKSRVTKSNPFSNSGLDYFGPIYIRSTDAPRKVWICLFTCLVTRAVHLELVNDMSTEEFLLAFRRFIAQRGTTTHIISDNAKQFKAAASVIDRVWIRILQSEEVQNYVANEKIKWSFIVELAPWMGGFYERLVGIVKRSFRKAIGRKLLTLIQLQTLLKEVEAVVNSRPLTYVGDDIHSTIALTPSHFLTLNPKIGLPQLPSQDDKDYMPVESSTDKLLSIWRKGQALLDTFWKIWSEEYLLSLRERTQTRLKTNRIQSFVNPSVGDIVIVKDQIPRGNWKFGKIEQLIKSSDGEIRSCKVRLPSGNKLNRPLNLLFPIETSQETNINHQNGSDINDNNNNNLVKKEEKHENEETSVQRQSSYKVRLSSVKARRKIREQLLN